MRAERAKQMLRLLGAAFVMAVAGCGVFGGQVDPRAQRAADVFECYVAAITPYVGGVCDVEELVRDAIAGRANVPQALALLGSTADDLRSVDAALGACRGASEAPAVNPRTLAFREPPADL